MTEYESMNDDTTDFGSADHHEQDRVDRWIGLAQDGRLGEPERRELDAILKRSESARSTKSRYGAIRDGIRSVAVPPPSHDLLAKTLQRVEAARAVQHREGIVLPWIRGIAIAAALMLAANTVMFKAVRADDAIDHTVTVEDELRAANAAHDKQPESLVDYLAWYFLRRGR